MVQAMPPLLSATSLLSCSAAPSILDSAFCASTRVLRRSLGSLPASAFLVSASCGPSSMAKVLSRSAAPLSLVKVFWNSATAVGSSDSACWMLLSCLARPARVVLRLRSESLTAWMLSGLSSSFSRSTVVPALDSSSCAEVEVTCRNEAPSRISG